MCITNSFILSKFCNSTSQPTKEDSRLKTFRAHLAESLIGSYTSRQRAGRPEAKVWWSHHLWRQHFTPLVTTTVSGAYTATKLETPLQERKCVAVQTMQGRINTMPHRQRGRLRLLVSMAPGLGPGQTTCLHLGHPYLCIFIYVNYP